MTLSLFPDDLPSLEPPGESLAEARARVLANLDEGIECPCCDRRAKRYWRSIYHMQCVRMARLYRLMLARPDVYYFDLADLDRNAHEIATLLHWGLVEAEELTPEEKAQLERKSRGRWRLTPDGILFLRGQLSLPKYAVIYNDAVQFFSGDNVLVDACLKKKFSYAELMDGIPLDVLTKTA